MAEKPDRLRELSVGDLNRKERELTDSLFNLRMRVATKQMAAFAGIKFLRRDIARIKTVKAELEAKGGRESAKEENGKEENGGKE